MNRTVFLLVQSLLTLSEAMVFNQFTFKSTNQLDNNDNISNLILKTYNDENGLPTSEANTICTTSDGYVWIGSYGGLIRYDGIEFVNYSQDPSFGISSIRSIRESSDGVLYIGTNDAGIYKYDGNFEAVYLENGGLVPSVRSLVADDFGNVYAGTTSGIYKISNGSAKSLNIDSNNTVYSLAYSNGCLSATDYAGSLLFIKDDELKLSIAKGDVCTNNFYCSYMYENDLYAGTSGSDFFKFDITKLANNDLTHDTYSLDSYYATERMVMSNDILWVATGSGIGYFDENMDFHSNAEFASCSNLNDIAVDFEGNVWLASTKYGVYELVQGSFYHLAKSLENVDSTVNAIEKSSNKYYIGTDKGVAILNNEFVQETNEVTEYFKEKKVRHIYKDSSNRLFFAVQSEGVYVYSDSTISKISVIPNVTSRNVLELSNHKIAVATDKGVYVISNDLTTLLESYGKDEGMVNTLIMTLVEGENGYLFAGSDGSGVYQLKDGAIVNAIAQADNHNVGVVMRMYKDEEYYYISSGSSLFVTDNQNNIFYVDSLSAGVGGVFDFYSDGTYVYLFKSDGIYRVKRSELLTNSVSEINTYNSANGLVGTITSNSHNLFLNDTFFIGTNKGISILSINDNEEIDVAPRVIITSVSYLLNDEEHYINDYSKGITLASDVKRLTIEFECLHYGGCQYELTYGLTGFETGVTNISANNIGRATYTNLKGGQYEFVISAKTHGSDEVYTFKLGVNKIKAWHEHTGLILLVVLISLAFLLAGLYAIAKVRIVAVRKEKERYKELTNSALHTIAKTIDAKDEYTKGHSERVAKYSKIIGERMHLSDEEVEKLYFTALLHDIGKIGVPDNVLNKNGPLTDEEYGIIKSHTTLGGEILKEFKILPEVREGAIGHHERYDGKGYPHQLKGKDNSLFARIISVADTYDAMSSTRPYRTARSLEYCVKELTEAKNTQLDGEISQIFIDYLLEEDQKKKEQENNK